MFQSCNLDECGCGMCRQTVVGTLSCYDFEENSIIRLQIKSQLHHENGVHSGSRTAFLKTAFCEMLLQKGGFIEQV